MTTEKKTCNSLNWGGFWQAQKKDYFISQPISKASLKKLLDTGEKQRIVTETPGRRSSNSHSPTQTREKTWQPSTCRTPVLTHMKKTKTITKNANTPMKKSWPASTAPAGTDRTDTTPTTC